MVLQQKVRARLGSGAIQVVYHATALLSGALNTITADDLGFAKITTAIFNPHVITKTSADISLGGTMSVDAAGDQAIITSCADSDEGTIIAWGY